MLKDRMQAALCEQINHELYSSYLYLSMVSYFDAKNLPGFSHWLRVQVEEELLHVTKMFDFVHNRNGRVILQPIAAPPADWESPLAAFEAVYRHECGVTERINKLVDLAIELSDHATNNMLQWFVTEQVEEEANTNDIVEQLRMVGDSGHGLILLDRELATRPAATPPDQTAP